MQEREFRNRQSEYHDTLTMAACDRGGKSAATIPTRLTFVDIAGLVRGASKGEQLPNVDDGWGEHQDGLDTVKNRFSGILTDLHLETPKELAQ